MRVSKIRSSLEKLLKKEQWVDEDYNTYLIRLYDACYYDLLPSDFSNLPVRTKNFLNKAWEQYDTDKTLIDFPDIIDFPDPEKEVIQEKEVIEKVIDPRMILASNCIQRYYYMIDDVKALCYRVGLLVVSFKGPDGEHIKVKVDDYVLPLNERIQYKEFYNIHNPKKITKLPKIEKQYQAAYDQLKAEKKKEYKSKIISRIMTAESRKISEDKLGYTRVEAFIDAMKNGGTREEIIRQSQKNFLVASQSDGTMKERTEATLYYNVLQRFCARLGLLSDIKGSISFERNEMVILDRWNKFIMKDK